MNQTPAAIPHLLSDPADVGALVTHVRGCDDAIRTFRWFRRLMLLPAAYVNRDIIAVDGDVVRKALRCSAAITMIELARVANSSLQYHRSIPSFIAACLLVGRRIDRQILDHAPLELDNCDDNFKRCVALIAKKTKASSVLQAQRYASEKNCVTIVLRTGGYSDLARLIGRHICQFGRRIRHIACNSEYRAYTDRWTFSIGHIVILGYLIKAHEEGLVECPGVRIWKGIVANRYLMDRVAALSSDFEYVEPRTTFGDNHSVNHSEWVDGEYLNYFDACGRIADSLGDATGAILPRPSASEDPLRAFLAASGLGPDARIVTVHCREPGFRRDRRHDMRNVEIASYIPAMRMLAERGYKVVRLGDRSMTPLPPIPGVFDYARSELKSPELDVLLPGAAEFHIGSSSGLSLVPLLFGTPCLYLNWYPLDMVPWGRRNRTVLRPLLNLRTGGPATDAADYFRVGRLADETLLRASGFMPAPLSDRDITAAVTDFVDDPARRQEAPEKTGRNRGRFFMVAPGDAAERFVEIPGREVPSF